MAHRPSSAARWQRAASSAAVAAGMRTYYTTAADLAAMAEVIRLAFGGSAVVSTGERSA